MSRKDAFVIIICSLVGLYFVFVSTLPRYEYIDDQTPDLLRFDRVKGVLQVSKEHYGGKWYKVVSKSLVKVEKPTIAYDEFMQKRKESLDFFDGVAKETAK